MLYILLVIVIVLLLVIAHRTRDKGREAQRYWNKLFSKKLNFPEFQIDDPRNKTHPEEFVTYRGRAMNGVNMARKDAEKLDNAFEKSEKYLTDRGL